ncbi:alpha/beta fold hydrolase [Pseudonocardia sp. WMMC193]|uniref:lipase family alpha/beta hydrolase n=1 Tax=Pseudonocardia sp. WMMC193 TaxID=2911965 RepID=UPI001F338021|nr:alpha/beta fold hydrolase [Pseudonocardia sp. WMMC193]MCF7547542.1 alpha/beta fold hydrolase [Pseudonocardia sp. WMMC193]
MSTVRRRVAILAVTSAAVLAPLLTVGQAGAAPTAPIPPLTPSPFPVVAPADLPLPPPLLPDETFAPVDRPGPALSVPEADLDAALTCTANATDADRNVALFVPGTTMTPQVNFGFTWFSALDALGRPYCSVTLPDNAMGDTQTAAEYVVHAIREIHRISGHKVDVLGHSQGGTEPRFALRFWPDLRPMVDDYIAFGATNHGSILINAALCPPATGCAPALWQQTANSHYTQAINSYQETFPGISYTQIYTRTDEFVQPNLDDTGTTSLHGGGGDITNVALQDVCLTEVASEHIAVGTYSPVAYALAMDALDHDGPADPARIDPAACTEVFMPGVNPLTFATDYGAAMTLIGTQLALAPRVASEPELRPYTLAG